MHEIYDSCTIKAYSLFSLMDEQTRINAMISYFFLGPIFLLAKKDTPLANPYVRWHSKKASIIIGLTFLIFLIYYFLFRQFLNFSLLTINVQTIVLSILVFSCVLLLLSWAYKAYLWETINEWRNLEVPDIFHAHSTNIETEEEKIRILGSMIPFLGIFISHISGDRPLMVRARILGSAFAFLFLFSLFLWSSEGILPFILIITYILFFVTVWVYLFVYDRFLSWDILEKIPSYRSLEAHIMSSVRSITEFFRVSFGKPKEKSYQQFYEEECDPLVSIKSESPYFMPPWLIGIPFWNIFTIPSLFIEKYAPYRRLILAGFIITLIYTYIFFYQRAYTHPMILMLIFPIIHILVFAREDLSTHVPGIELILRFFESFTKVREKIITIKKTEQNESFRYEEK